MSVKITWGADTKAKGWDGLNNAAINSFNSDITRSFVREMFQNSNDARQKQKGGRKKKLRVELNYTTLTSSDIPGLDRLHLILKKIASEKANSGHEPFFNQALESLKDKKRITVLEYKDFNTTGLSGNDEDATSTFNACVLSEGISNKNDKTAGGSYGIGKNAIYGFSKIRTVLYSSLNENGEHIFQGVAKLASYKEGSRTYESRIFLGEGEKFKSVRNFRKLSTQQQNILKRDKPGLTQIILCPIKHDLWVDEFCKAILKNYWQLLSSDELEVYLKEDGKEKIKITSGTFEKLLCKYFPVEGFDPSDDSKPLGNPLDFYRCYENSEPLVQTVHAIGKVSLYYQELPHKKTNRISFIRNGMVILSEKVPGFDSIGYCGVIVAEEKEGNEILRMMEPPTHDSFDPSRLDEKSLTYKEKDGKRALKEMRALIRDALNSILDKYRKDAEEIPWLNELISSLIGSSGSGNGARTGSKAEEETASKIASEQTRNIKFNSLQKNSVITLGNGEDEGSGERGGGGRGGNGGNGGGNGGNGGREEGKSKGKRTPFRYRIFKKGKGSNTSHSYVVKIHSNEQVIGKDLIIKQIGDSGDVASFRITKLSDENGRDVRFNELRNADGELKGYQLKSLNLPIVLQLEVTEPYSSAFTINE